MHTYTHAHLKNSAVECQGTVASLPDVSRTTGGNSRRAGEGSSPWVVGSLGVCEHMHPGTTTAENDEGVQKDIMRLRF